MALQVGRWSPVLSLFRKIIASPGPLTLGEQERGKAPQLNKHFLLAISGCSNYILLVLLHKMEILRFRFLGRTTVYGQRH